MSDIALKWNPEKQRADFIRTPLDLATDDGLETAILIALFSDRRAEPDDVPPGDPADRRGWWGDAFAKVPGHQTGSRLWLLSRAKTEAEALLLAADYGHEALAWLVTDGVLERVTVAAERMGDIILALVVDCVRPNEAPKQFRFKAFWGRV